jgi:exodeoxyribonuclease V gamma subunit
MDGRDPDPEDLRFTGKIDSYRPETVEEERREALAAFAEGVRGLITTARSVRSEQRSLSGWFRWMGQFIREHLEPSGSSEEPEFYGYLDTLQSLAEMECGPETTDYSTAMEFTLDELSALEYRRGHYLASGAVVASFKPQRPIPFDGVFMLGMNEGDLPASSPRSPIDLQSEQWQEGDLWDRDRERYMFLETLLSARKKVYLSWISRDPVTGKDIEPSSVFREFQQILEGYLGDDRLEQLTVEHPLHRSDPAYFESGGPGPTYNPEALAEARARRTRNRVIEAHGWSIRITEGRDGGARFEVTGVEPAGE